MEKIKYKMQVIKFQGLDVSLEVLNKWMASQDGGEFEIVVTKTSDLPVIMV